MKDIVNIYVDYCWEDIISFSRQENKLTEMKTDKEKEQGKCKHTKQKDSVTALEKMG
jgi:hypothetical protein